MILLKCYISHKPHLKDYIDTIMDKITYWLLLLRRKKWKEEFL